MIRTLKALALVLAFAPLAAFAGTPVDVKISGMTCGACVKKVNDELVKLKDIDKSSVKVELEGNHATLTMAKNDPKVIEAIKKAVTKAGYKVEKVDIVAAAATDATKTAEGTKAN